MGSSHSRTRAGGRDTPADRDHCLTGRRQEAKGLMTPLDRPRLGTDPAAQSPPDGPALCSARFRVPVCNFPRRREAVG